MSSQSQVYAFRLNPTDNDDLQAMDIIETLRDEGWSIKEIVLTAILQAGKIKPVGRPANRIGQTADDLQALVSQTGNLPADLQAAILEARRLADRLANVTIAPAEASAPELTEVQVNTALVTSLQSNFRPGFKKGGKS